MKTNNLLYSIVVPVYNSQKSLEELAERIDKTFKKIKKNYEIIFVDDNHLNCSININLIN